MDEKLVLYQTYVETITANENRRHQLKSIYLTVVAALIAAGGSLGASFFLVTLAVLFVSFFWLMSMLYFSRLASAKFKVIELMEKDFSFAPFREEWIHFKKSVPVISLTQIDIFLPLTVMSFSFVSVVVNLIYG